MANPSTNFEMIRLYPKLNSDPLVGKPGEIYYNNILKTLRLCTNSTPTWVSVGAGDEAFQDKNALLIEGGYWSNTPDGFGSNTIAFSNTAHLQIPGLANTSNTINATSFVLAVGEVAYVDINRLNSPSNLTIVVSSVNTISANSNRLIIARNIGGTIILNNRFAIMENMVGKLDSNQTTLDVQDRNVQLIGGGVWKRVGNVISHNQDAYILMHGLPKESNTLTSTAHTLNSGEFLLATSLFRSGASNALVTTITSSPISTQLDAYIIAYNDGTRIWLANGESFIDGESKQNGESTPIELLSAIGAADFSDKTGQLRILAEETASTFTFITPIQKTVIDSTNRSMTANNLDTLFAGVKINWNTGSVYNYAGVTLLSTFTAPTITIPTGESRWYSVSLIVASINASNEAVLQVAVLPATNSTTKASYTTNAIAVGQVLLTNDSGIIQNISQSNIIQNIIGSGTGGANTHLSNLETTAINQDLLPDTNNTRQLGSNALAFSKVVATTTNTTQIGTISGSGSITINNTVSMSSHQINNVQDPTSNQDAATKKYVDDVAATKLSNVVEDLTPQLGGDLDLNSKVLTGSLKHGTSSNYSTTDFSGPIALADNTVNGVVLTYPITFKSAFVSYSMERNGILATGRIMIANNGSSAVYSDERVETAQTFVAFTAAIVGANIEVRYTSAPTGFGATIKCSVLKI